VTAPAVQEIVIRRLTTEQLGAPDLGQLLDLFTACWPAEEFSQEDIAHAMGGVHWLAESLGRVVGHASVVPRWIEADGHRLMTGYVEAVCTHPAWQRRGVASRLLERANDHIRDQFELGVLSTGVGAVYASSGWEHWRGETWVITATGRERTPDDDDGIMILRTPRTPAGMDAVGPIACEWRAGDVW
jgi:aminoglycoside 2'-N-acetyltransferase I